ncbi:hypothetical protein BRC62_06135 [Halobacteriales archaeon QH_10_67_13]|nr:MAG: hypothetical protein BRC62_06135 [Halobacteriales archaeon QH_10_67_13]
MAPTRRRLLAIGGVALLAGCLESDSQEPAEQNDSNEDPATDSDDQPDGDRTGEPSLSEDLATVLGAIPRTVGDRSIRPLWIVAPPSEGSETESDLPAVPNTTLVAQQLGLDPEAIDRAAVAVDPDETAVSLAVAVGSFGGEALDPPGDIATRAADGFAIFARNDGPWEAGLEAARDAAADPEAGIGTTLEPVVAPIQDNTFIGLAPNAEGISFEDPDSVERVAVGRRLVGGYDQRVEFAVRFVDREAATETAVETIIDDQRGNVDELDVEYERVGPEDRTVVGSFVTQLPPSQLPDNAPDARFRFRDSKGVLEQIGEEPVDPARVELRVGGEKRAPPWDDREAPIEPGDRFEIDVDPFQLVEVVWLDPEFDVERPLGRSVASGRDAFEGEHDPDADALTITYTKEFEADARRFSLQRGGPGPEDDKKTDLESLVGERLTAGDSITVEDVGYGDRIDITLTVERSRADEAYGITMSVFSFIAEPPGRFEFIPEDGTVTITYRGSERQPAENYRIGFAGEDEPASVQFADQYDRLTDGDSVAVDVAVGDRIVVEWVGDDRPFRVDEYTVTPDATFEIGYDEGAEELTIPHAGGDPIDPERLRVEVFGAPVENHTPWAETYETVEPDDAVVLSVAERPRGVFVVFDGSTVLAEREFTREPDD